MSCTLFFPRPLILAGLLCLVGTATLSAQTPPPAKPLLWPEGGRPALTYSVEKVPFDGVNITIGLLSGPGISWENKFFHSWTIAKTSGNYSIAFFSKENVDLKLGIALFGPTEFLPDISDSVWAGYLAGLQQLHNDRCDILEQLSASVEGSPWIPVLGSPTRSITIRYPVDDTHCNAEVQIFAFCKDRLVVFVLSGPEEAVEAAKPEFVATVRTIRTYRPSN